MTTLSTIRGRVKINIAEDSMLDDAQITSIIQMDHATILEDYAWARRKTEVMLQTVAPYSVGTVSATAGTNIVAGASTAWTSALIGRHIRIGSQVFFHKISDVQSATSMTLEATLPVTVPTGSAYTVFQHRYNLPSDFSKVLSITSDNRMLETPKLFFDEIDPYRSSTANYPDRYTLLGLDPTNTTSQIFQIEFYPVPSTASSIRVEYLKTNTLDSDGNEPLYRADVLVWKASESAAHFLFAKTGDQTFAALAERYHQRYEDTFQAAKEDDLARFSAVTHVRDTSSQGERGDDFYISHDPLRLR